jgi:hypothetical protein
VFQPAHGRGPARACAGSDRQLSPRAQRRHRLRSRQGGRTADTPPAGVTSLDRHRRRWRRRAGRGRHAQTRGLRRWADDDQRDSDPPVDRPNLSKDYLAGAAKEDWIPLRGPEYFEEQRIDLRLGSRVTGLDAAAKRLHLEDGSTTTFDALLIATGADPVRLDRVVVIGASFIGQEVAASLRTRELDVHVVAPESQPLERVMGAEVGKFIRSLHTRAKAWCSTWERRSAAWMDAQLPAGSRVEVDRVVPARGDGAGRCFPQSHRLQPTFAP